MVILSNSKRFIASIIMTSAAMFSSQLSFADTTIVGVVARNTMSCHHAVCVEHQTAPAYFAAPLRGASSLTVQIKTATTEPIFINPNGLPALRKASANHPAPTQDCVYQQHILKPGGEMIRKDPKRGIDWHRVCHDVHGHGVLSPAVG